MCTCSWKVESFGFMKLKMSYDHPSINDRTPAVTDGGYLGRPRGTARPLTHECSSSHGDLGCMVDHVYVLY